MKVVMSLLPLFIFSCHSNRNLIADSISGTYVHSFKNEFTIAYDTIVIQVYNKDAGSYLITDQVGFNPIRKGKMLPKEFKQTTHIGIFDENAAQLMDQKTGAYYTFPSKGEELLVGISHYKRIK